MSLADGVFVALAACALCGAAGVAFSRSILTSAFSLLLSLLGVAGLYGFLGADVAAIAQVLVYIGGVVVLILFAIMMTRKVGEDALHSNPVTSRPIAIALGAAMLATLAYVALRTPWTTQQEATLPLSTAPAIGSALLDEWVLPFEIVSLVMLAALLGAAALARKEFKE